MSENLVTDESLDVCGLNCPLPLLKAKQALNRMIAGQTLSVVCTDPGSVRDFSVFAEQSGHVLLSSDAQGGKFFYVLKKAENQ
ncbi:MAG: sulfurtransferase TusA family protein [Pseudomonadales bacterium]|nr:sulfurtransferase TusA family protein [Pseudomonadales bacterium]